MPFDQLDLNHRFYHDKAAEMHAWAEANKTKPLFALQALALVNWYIQYDAQDKATRYENLRLEITQYSALRRVNPSFRDDRFDPSDKDDAWVQDVAFEPLGGLVILVRYLDDYTFRQPYWCTQFIALA